METRKEVSLARGETALKGKRVMRGHRWVSERPQTEAWGDTVERHSESSSGTCAVLPWLAEPREVVAGLEKKWLYTGPDGWVRAASRSPLHPRMTQNQRRRMCIA